MKIRTKLIIVVCSLIIAMLAQFWGFHYVFRQSSTAGSSAVLYLNSAHLLAALESNINGARKELSNFVLTDDVTHLQALPEYVVEAERVLEGLTQVQSKAAQKTDEDSRLVYYESRKIAEEGYTLVSQLQGEIGRFTPDGATSLNLTELKNGIDWRGYNDQLDLLQKKISVATKRVLDKTLGVQEELDTIYKSNLNLGIIILLLALLVAIAASGVIQLQIVGGVQRLCDLLKNLKGDGLDSELAPWSSDEFEQIVSAVNNMNARLKESMVSKGYLDKILSSMAEGLCVVHADWTVVSANRRACQFLGLQVDQSKGRSLREFLVSSDGIENAYEKYLSNPDSGQIEQRLSLKAPVPRDVSLAWQKLGDEADRSELFVVTFADISERKILEQKLMHSQKIDAIGKLAGGVAHDFNNLLAGIGGSAHMLKSYCKDQPQLMEQVSIITQCVQHASDLTRKLLGFSRKAQHSASHISLRSVLDQVVGIIEKTLPKDIAIESQIPKGTWNVVGDNSQLASVLINLALNSRDAISGKGVIKFFVANQDVTGTFSREGLLHELPDGSYVRISVQDNGKGVSDDIRTKIFEPFFTTKQIGSGTGLGLSMVSEIVKNHRGSLRISSQTGLGTCVDIFLPADTRAYEESDFDHLSMKGAENRDFSILKGKTVMLVDDEPLVRTVTRKFLEQHGCEVVTAENGEVALEIFNAHNARFDAVILDVIMPRKDGIETFNELRIRSPKLPIIFYSGYAEAEQLQKAGVDAEKNFIAKPYLPEEFLETLSQAVSSVVEPQGEEESAPNSRSIS